MIFIQKNHGWYVVWCQSPIENGLLLAPTNSVAIYKTLPCWSQTSSVSTNGSGFAGSSFLSLWLWDLHVDGFWFMVRRIWRRQKMVLGALLIEKKQHPWQEEKENLSCKWPVEQNGPLPGGWWHLIWTATVRKHLSVIQSGLLPACHPATTALWQCSCCPIL